MCSGSIPRGPGALCLGTVLLLFSLVPAFVHSEDSNKHVPGLDVTKATFNATLSAMPGDAHVLMEFYATWCPACRAFKPEYDKVVRFLQAQPAGPNKVVALRLDCAVDPDICGTYQVAAYPTMYAASAADFASVTVDSFKKFDYGKYTRNAPGVVKFVSDVFKVDLTYVEVREEQKPIPAGAKGETKVIAADLMWTAPDVQLATVQLFESITAQEILHNTPDKRQALMDLLQVWSSTHPVASCKSGSASILKKFEGIWPEGKDKPVSDLKALKICGECSEDSGLCSPDEPPAAAAAAAAALNSAAATSKARASGGSSSGSGKTALTWVACRGSKPEQRGFTCALWLLFHTTAARLTDANSARLFMKSLKGFAHEFFQCAVCKKHFERVTSSSEAAAVSSQREAVLWVWRAHNEVNDRLAVIEKKYGHSSTGDTAYPKVSWPTKSACPQCRLPVLQKKSDERGGSDGGRRTGESQAYGEEPPIQWNEEEVYRFLMKWYGSEPGDGTDGTNGPNAYLVGQSDVDESSIYAEDASSNSGLHSGSFLSVVVFAVIVLVAMYWLYGRHQQRRRHPGYAAVKGPGVAVGGHHFHHHHHHKGSHGGPKHSVRLDAEAWGGARYPAAHGKKGSNSS